jgi:SARP family transcriptional regulator, regulator of embCAB operon
MRTDPNICHGPGHLRLNFELLGPLAVLSDHGASTPKAPKQRQILALLLMHANRTVTRASLIEELWDSSPPPSAVAAVHTYVMQIRRALRGNADLERGAPDRLITRNQGYEIRVYPDELDMNIFQQKIKRALPWLRDGHYERAATRLRSALALWKSQTLVNVPVGSVLQAAIQTVENSRLEALDARIEAELRCGRHHELIGELAAESCRRPTNETVAAHLMLALYRSGRQADAMESFHRLRHNLRSDLGTSPSARLYQLYSEILSGHSNLALARGMRTGLSLDLVDSAL